MIFFDKLTDFVFDERKKISSKAAIILLSLLGLLFIDNLIGFSHNYKLNNKIDHIQKLNALILDSKTDKSTKIYLIKLRNETLNRKNILEIFSEYVKSSPSDKTNINRPKNDNITSNLTAESINTFFHLTSSILFYLLAILMIPFIFFLDRNSSFPQRIAMGLMLCLMFAGIGIFLYWLCSLIPKIWNESWIINYIINVLIQVFFMYALFKFVPKTASYKV
jgi:hypothetical protein